MAIWFDDFLFTYQSLVASLGINALLALSMYVVLSIGQLSLGQAAFMGLGAYSSSLLTLKWGWPIAFGLGGSICVPALCALIIGKPTLRLSGVYLALATIGLGEMLRITLLNLDVTGSALGLSGIPTFSPLIGLAVIYAALALIIIVVMLIIHSHIGRAMEALREDESAAAIMGLHTGHAKLTALVVSAMIAGLAGALNAHMTSFISPNDYGFDAAVTILSYALLGGIASPFGCILGAVILTLLPELLRPLHDMRTIVNGLIIVIAVLYMPRGVLPWRPSRFRGEG
jgi:branched-chain amino acid transport system permease protein